MDADNDPVIQAKIRANVAAHRAVNEIIEEIVPMVLGEKTGKVDADKFWRFLAEEAAGRVCCVLKDDGPDAGPASAMNYQEALLWEATQIPWGAHAGEYVGEVTPRYFLAITEGEFSKQLTRYLRSTRFLERQQ